MDAAISKSLQRPKNPSSLRVLLRSCVQSVLPAEGPESIPAGRVALAVVLAIVLPNSASGAGFQEMSNRQTIMLPNPSAVFCESEGGTYRIVHDAGGDRGICILPDGREYDAWEYFRMRHGQTPSGGQKY